MKKILLLLSIMLLPVVCFGQEINEGMVMLLNVIAPFIATYAAKWTWLAVLLKVMFYSRIVVKPLMSAAIEVGEQLPEGKYRKFMKDMSGHSAYKIVSYLLDWFASIKLPKK